MMISSAPFVRVCKEVTHDMTGTSFRFQTQPLKALQETAEAYLGARGLPGHRRDEEIEANAKPGIELPDLQTGFRLLSQMPERSPNLPSTSAVAATKKISRLRSYTE